MNINVLFVDDDKDVLEGFKRMLFQMRKSWGQFFASDGQEALEILKNNDIDVAIIDMKMPVMSGDELLLIIQKNFPKVLRIILSGQKDEINTIRSLVSAHQFLTKPCDANQIKGTIEHAYALRNLVENKEIIAFINGIDTLPSLPGIYLEMQDEMNKEEVSFIEISKILAKDPALTLKILQTVNSGFFGLPRRITNLTVALSFLGVNTVKSITLFLNVYSPEKITGNFVQYMNQISLHSMKTASIGKAISKLEKLDRTLSDDIFIACLLHDIGKLVLMKNPDYFNQMTSLMKSSNISWLEAEKVLLNFNHQALGAYLLGIWGIPKNIIESTAFHHNPSLIEDNEITCLTLVHVANAFANYNSHDFVLEKTDIDLSYTNKIFDDNKLKLWWSETQNITES